MVDVPEALASALVVDTRARHAFEVLTPAHRDEYARWVAEAEQDETRERRVWKAIEMLRAGVKHP